MRKKAERAIAKRVAALVGHAMPSAKRIVKRIAKRCTTIWSVAAASLRLQCARRP